MTEIMEFPQQSLEKLMKLFSNSEKVFVAVRTHRCDLKGLREVRVAFLPAKSNGEIIRIRDPLYLFLHEDLGPEEIITPVSDKSPVVKIQGSKKRARRRDGI